MQHQFVVFCFLNTNELLLFCLSYPITSTTNKSIKAWTIWTISISLSVTHVCTKTNHCSSEIFHFCSRNRQIINLQLINIYSPVHNQSGILS